MSGGTLRDVVVSVLSLAMTVAAAGPVKLAATSMTLVDVSEARGRFFEQQLMQQLALQGLQVTTAADIGRMLGLERQRQLLGCSETGCEAELAGALGANGVVASSLAHVGSEYTLNVRVTGPRQAETLSVFSAHAADEDEVLATINSAARKVASDLLRGERPIAGIERSSARGLAWVPALAGAVFAIGGGVLFWQSTTHATRLMSGTFGDLGELRAAAALGALEQGLGIAGFAVGGAALASALVMLRVGQADAPALTWSLRVGTDGYAAGLGGTW